VRASLIDLPIAEGFKRGWSLVAYDSGRAYGRERLVPASRGCMPFEIERKFLASPAVLDHCQSGTIITQGYLFTDARNTIRIRRADMRAFLTWKGPKSGPTRDETEVEVPLAMGKALLAIVSPRARLRKIRYRVDHAGAIWDVDVFAGRHEGLILAEIEMAHEDQAVMLPPWVEREVTGDERYRNSRLAALTRSIRRAA
jgi:adenylate cyclase